MADRKKRGWVKWMLVLLLIGGAAVGYYFYQRQPKDPPVEFRTAPAARGDLTQMVTANGQLTPVINVEVGSQVSGTIQNIFADFNTRVTNGQVIAQIEPSTFEANVLAAEAELANAKAALELARLNARRAEELHKSRLISASDFDQTVATLHQAEASVKMREASLRRSRTDLERSTIYAPIDGIVISRNVEVGQTVAASFNTPRLFQIANDLSKMEIEAMVSEADVGGVEEGQRVTFTVDAFPTRQFEGKVKQVRFAPTTNQNVVTYTTVVEVNNEELKLRPGMTANASIITAERSKVLKVPNAALRFRPPENALVKSPTNQITLATAATNPAAGAAERPGGPPEGDRREEFRRRLESMTPEQRAEFRQRMQSRGGGSGRSGEGRSATGDPSAAVGSKRALYLVEKQGTRTLAKPVTVKLGITDGTSTEILEGLTEGQEVIIGLNTPVAAVPSTVPQGSSPFGRPFGGGPPRPR